MFLGITTTVKNTLNESCVQILSPQRRIDILRDALDAKQQRRPYCITFCGVNGVGKSTNLAKVRLVGAFIVFTFLFVGFILSAIDISNLLPRYFSEPHPVFNIYK